MVKVFPFKAKTETGDSSYVKFPLHAEAGNAVQLNNLISSLLVSIENNIKLSDGIGDGDVCHVVAITAPFERG